MTALFLSPHNDDETLFGAYSIMREAPDVHVVVVLEAQVQQRRGGPSAKVREAETHCALRQLLDVDEPDWWQWGGPCNDIDPNWDVVQSMLLARGAEYAYTRVYAPVVYGEALGGQVQHDKIGLIAHQVFGTEGLLARQGDDSVPVIGYHTYTHGRGRVTGEPVETRPEWTLRKLRALACYESQIMLASTGHHFEQALYEWID